MNKKISIIFILCVLLGCKNKTSPVEEDKILLETDSKSNNYFDDVVVRKTFDYSNEENDAFLYNKVKYVDDILENSEGAAFYDESNKSYSKVKGFDVTNNFTIAVWFKPKEILGSGFSPIVNRSINGIVIAPSYQFLFGLRGKEYKGSPYTFIFWMSVNGELKQLSSLINWVPDSWYHLTATYDGNFIKFYVNGKFQTQKQAVGTIENSNQDIFFGKHFKYDSYTNGALDDFQYYSRVLSSDEIITLTE